jgi:predicted MFS family arabinose efflux permease
MPFCKQASIRIQWKLPVWSLGIEQEVRPWQMRGKEIGIKQLSKNYKIVVLVSITVARAVYALNWYTLSPGLSQVAHDFQVSTSNIGILEATFLFGAGLFQIPSTIGAARWGAKSLCVAGMLVICASNLLGGLANSFSLLVLLRFILGIGVSTFFAPAIAVVTELFQNEREGLLIGIYNSAFSVGGSFALFGWAYFDTFFTWRGGLMIGAILAGIIGVENYFLIRNSTDQQFEKQTPIEALRGVFKNKEVWLLSFGLVGIWSAYYVVGQLLPFFEETLKNLDTNTSSFMAAQIFLWPIPASVLGGYLSDRFRNRRLFMIIPGLVMGILISLIGLANFTESWLIVIIIGITDAFIFTALYASVYQMPELDKNQKIISIALMNSVQITGAFFGPLLYSYLALNSYTYAWLAVGIFVLPFLLALVVAKEPFASIGRK